jgi:hypothetical protein
MDKNGEMVTGNRGAGLHIWIFDLNLGPGILVLELVPTGNRSSPRPIAPELHLSNFAKPAYLQRA